MHRLYRARHLFPVTSPPVLDGAVLVDERSICAVGPATAILADLPRGTEIRDLGDTILLPGLVNAHTHIELSALGDERRPAGGDYTSWVSALLEARASLRPDEAVAAAVEALEVVVQRGTVALGDIANELWVGPLLANSELDGVLFYEIYGMRQEDAEAILTTATDRMEELCRHPAWQSASGRWTLALTPHAPQTTSTALLRALTGRAAASNEPISIHVAESTDEGRFLADGSGALGDLLRTRGQLDPKWKAPAATPVAWLHRVGLWNRRSLAVHAVHLDHQDRSLLQSHGSTVVTCPRSNEYLGVGTAPIPELMREGVPVALGTDSLATTPDLDLFAEIAALLRIHPTIQPAAALRMATVNGAVALGLDARYGSISAGRSARLVAIPLDVARPADRPLEQLRSTPEIVFPIADCPWEGPT